MKDLIKRFNSKPINKNSQPQNFYRPGYELEVKKQLNLGGKVFIALAYTFAIVFSTLKFKDEKTSRISWEDREIIKRELLKEIEAKQSFASATAIVNTRVSPREVRVVEKGIVPQVSPTPLKETKLENNKIIKYSKVNGHVLKFKMHQKYKRLKETLNSKREILISSLDLNDPNHRIRIQDFDDNMKLELYTLRSKNYEIREQFEKNKYMAQN
jgi:hypothetical protein